MAINVLLNTWMVGEEFVSDVPKSVKNVVKKASKWLLQNVKLLKPYSGLFGASAKSQDVRIYSYVL